MARLSYVIWYLSLVYHFNDSTRQFRFSEHQVVCSERNYGDDDINSWTDQKFILYVNLSHRARHGGKRKNAENMQNSKNKIISIQHQHFQGLWDTDRLRVQEKVQAILKPDFLRWVDTSFLYNLRREFKLCVWRRQWLGDIVVVLSKTPTSSQIQKKLRKTPKT